MKRPVLTALIALAVVVLGLIIAGSLTNGVSHVERSMVLNGPPERVWPFFADLPGWTKWYRAEDGTRMTYSALTTGTSSGMGVERHAEESSGSWWEEKVTGFDVEKRLELTGTNTPGRKDWRQEIKLEPEGNEKTKVTWTVDYSVEGQGPFMKLINKRTQEQFGNYMEGALKNIDPLVPSADEWGPSRKAASMPGKLPEMATTSAAPVGTAPEPAAVPVTEPAKP